MRWVKFGGENTKYFHVKEIEMYRHNWISKIKNEDGDILVDHHDKADAFWKCYKNRLGISSDGVAQANLSHIVSQVDNLNYLFDIFTLEEIEGVIQHLKVDKAPGPDGFNGLFVKKCWPIIKEDFIQLCNDFHKGLTSLDSINGSYITLIPKKNCLEYVNDFLPISLTNTCLKFLKNYWPKNCKKEIKRCIHENQYGFIKCRTIQDCLAWTFEYIYQCQ
jgi:hypothetical protein